MIDLRDYLNAMIEKHAIAAKADLQTAIAFLANNSWFGSKPAVANGTVRLTVHQMDMITPPLAAYLSTETDLSLLLEMLHDKLPDTHKILQRFYDNKKAVLTEDDKIYLVDFLLYRLERDIVMCRDEDIEELLQYAVIDLTKAHGDWLTYFLAWVRSRYRTAYCKDYVMAKRYTMTIQNQAYDLDTYLELMYFLFNADYIADNDMLRKAAQSQNYTDTWLYLAIHFISALRYTDLKRIYHPDLPCSAEEVLYRVKEGTFSDADARSVLLSITNRMCWLPLEPSKTAQTEGVGSVKLHFPDNCEVLFGTLFALAEAHRLVNGNGESPIIRKISEYRQITRYMGEEIGHLFLEHDFRGRSANKSYLQAVYALADDILEDGDGLSVKGYILASLARSHKGAYGEFAATTFTYLKDAVFSGLTPQFVAFELLQRGVLSFLPEMLLKMVTKSESAKLTPKQQTSAIRELGLSANEADKVVGIVNRGKRQAEKVLKEVLESGIDIMSALHKIGSGQAVSKEPECLCLMSAIEQMCPYATRRQCVGCKYEISTKSTFYLLVTEYNRMKMLYKNATDPLEKGKYKKMIKEIVVPKIDEMLYCLQQSYGEDAYIQYEQYLKENLLK